MKRIDTTAFGHVLGAPWSTPCVQENVSVTSTADLDALIAERDEAWRRVADLDDVAGVLQRDRDAMWWSAWLLLWQAVGADVADRDLIEGTLDIIERAADGATCAFCLPSATDEKRAEMRAHVAICEKHPAAAYRAALTVLVDLMRREFSPEPGSMWSEFDAAVSLLKEDDRG